MKEFNLFPLRTLFLLLNRLSLPHSTISLVYFSIVVFLNLLNLINLLDLINVLDFPSILYFPLFLLLNRLFLSFLSILDFLSIVDFPSIMAFLLSSTFHFALNFSLSSTFHQLQIQNRIGISMLKLKRTFKDTICRVNWKNLCYNHSIILHRWSHLYVYQKVLSILKHKSFIPCNIIIINSQLLSLCEHCSHDYLIWYQN